MVETSINLTKHLLAEEVTIDPSSPFPSFLEMKLVQETTGAGEMAIRTSIAAVIEHFNRTEITSRVGSIKQRIATLLAQSLASYQSEIEMIIIYFILRKSLISYSNSTLAESMYGLKRSRVSRDLSVFNLQEIDGVRAALLLSIGPYMKRRLDKYYEHNRDRDQYGTLEDLTVEQRTNSEPSRLKQSRSLFIYLYPFLHMSHNGIQLAYQFAFLIGKSSYFDVSQHFLRQIVRRVTLADINPAKNSKASVAKPFAEQIPEPVLLRIKKAAAIGVTSALLVGWIGKFRQEMRRNRTRLIINRDANANANADAGSGLEGQDRPGDMTMTGNSSSEVVIPPPPLPSSGKYFQDSVKPSSDPRLCPLCLQKRVNPAASSSGFVFCYKCLVVYLREKGPKCPIVGMRCEEKQVVRLYEPTDHVRNSD